MPEKFLHGPDVVSVFEEMGGKAVTKCMRSDAFGDIGLPGGVADGFI